MMELSSSPRSAPEASAWPNCTSEACEASADAPESAMAWLIVVMTPTDCSELRHSPCSAGASLL